MKVFDTMWDGVSEKVTEAVFRLEDDESFRNRSGRSAPRPHAEAPRALTAADDVRASSRRMRRAKGRRSSRSATRWTRSAATTVPVRQRQEVQELLHEVDGEVSG